MLDNRPFTFTNAEITLQNGKKVGVLVEFITDVREHLDAQGAFESTTFRCFDKLYSVLLTREELSQWVRSTGAFVTWGV